MRGLRHLLCSALVFSCCGTWKDYKEPKRSASFASTGTATISLGRVLYASWQQGPNGILGNVAPQPLCHSLEQGDVTVTNDQRQRLHKPDPKKFIAFPVVGLVGMVTGLILATAADKEILGGSIAFGSALFAAVPMAIATSGGRKVRHETSELVLQNSYRWAGKSSSCAGGAAQEPVYVSVALASGEEGTAYAVADPIPVGADGTVSIHNALLDSAQLMVTECHLPANLVVSPVAAETAPLSELRDLVDPEGDEKRWNAQVGLSDRKLYAISEEIQADLARKQQNEQGFASVSWIRAEDVWETSLYEPDTLDAAQLARFRELRSEPNVFAETANQCIAVAPELCLDGDLASCRTAIRWSDSKRDKARYENTIFSIKETWCMGNVAAEVAGDPEVCQELAAKATDEKEQMRFDRLAYAAKANAEMIKKIQDQRAAERAEQQEYLNQIQAANQQLQSNLQQGQALVVQMRQENARRNKTKRKSAFGSLFTAGLTIGGGKLAGLSTSTSIQAGLKAGSMVANAEGQHAIGASMAQGAQSIAQARTASSARSAAANSAIRGSRAFGKAVPAGQVPGAQQAQARLSGRAPASTPSRPNARAVSGSSNTNSNNTGTSASDAERRRKLPPDYAKMCNPGATARYDSDAAFFQEQAMKWSRLYKEWADTGKKPQPSPSMIDPGPLHGRASSWVARLQGDFKSPTARAFFDEEFPSDYVKKLQLFNSCGMQTKKAATCAQLYHDYASAYATAQGQIGKVLRKIANACYQMEKDAGLTPTPR